MHERMDMIKVAGDRQTVTVYYDGMTQWVKVKAGRVLKHTAGAELYGVHALGEARAALARYED